jgi:hypothetical protein
VHPAWEFWYALFYLVLRISLPVLTLRRLSNAWNFQAAAWNSYYVILLSEVVPQPKMYMFFALLNCVGKTSGFAGPLISSAIITRAGGNTNIAYWFLFGMGCIGICILACVNTDKAKIDVAKFLEREAVFRAAEK